jgi:hypothetical protein
MNYSVTLPYSLRPRSTWRNTHAIRIQEFNSMGVELAKWIVHVYRFLSLLCKHVTFSKWIVHACAASDLRRARVAQGLAGAAQNSTQDHRCMEEVRVKVAALYKVAYSMRFNEDGKALSEQELIMRMALPWHIAPRQLAALISSAMERRTGKSVNQGNLVVRCRLLLGSLRLSCSAGFLVGLRLAPCFRCRLSCCPLLLASFMSALIPSALPFRLLSLRCCLIFLRG